MFRRSWIVLPLVVLTGLALAAPVPTHLMKPPRYYYPTEVGATWIYRSYGVEDEIGHDYIEAVTAVHEKPGMKCISIGSSRDGKPPDFGGTVVAVSPSGLVQGTWVGDYQFKPNSQWLKLPFKSGEKWERDYEPVQPIRKESFTSVGGSA